MEIGPRAIVNAQTLLSTFYHEGGPVGSHVAQAPNNWGHPDIEIAGAVNELETARSERAISERLGLSQSEIDAIDWNIREQETTIKRLSPKHYWPRVQKGNCKLDAAHLYTKDTM